MKKLKRLTKGLAEFQATLSDSQFSGEILPRLKSLPGNGLAPMIEAHAEALALVAFAEDAARMARLHAASVAEKCFHVARKHWTIKQLQRATGYTDE